MLTLSSGPRTRRKPQSSANRAATSLASSAGERPEETTPCTPGRGDANELQEILLEQIARGAELCGEFERQLGENRGPELETIIKLHRIIILKLSVQAQVEPSLLRHVHGLTKSAIDWARLEEKRKDRELSEQKYRDELEAKKAARQKGQAEAGDGLRPETLKKIERELKLF